MINNLATKYRNTKCALAMLDLYKAFHAKCDRRIERDAKKYNITYEDVYAAYDDALWEVSELKNVENFEGCLNRTIRINLIKLIRDKNRLKRSKYATDVESGMLPDDKDEYDTYFQFADDYVLEDDAIERIQREREQKNIISALFENTNDVICIKMLQTAKTMAGDINAHSLGKAMGVSRKVVQLRFERLQSSFDRLDCGNIRDYLTA